MRFESLHWFVNLILVVMKCRWLEDLRWIIKIRLAFCDYYVFFMRGFQDNFFRQVENLSKFEISVIFKIQFKVFINLNLKEKYFWEVSYSFYNEGKKNFLQKSCLENFSWKKMRNHETQRSVGSKTAADADCRRLSGTIH